MKYFKNIQSFEELKSQFKKLAKENHPDIGGDTAIMQEINVEFDILFPIWKKKEEQATGAEINETPDSTRSEFYTQSGWKGSNHDWNRSLKEIAKIVRGYVKEKYPTYKFSVRTHYASMCQELTVDMLESPIPIYKEYDEITEEDFNDLWYKFRANNLWKLDSWTKEEQKAETLRIWEEKGNFFRVMNEITKSVVDDVDAFVNSYNFSDCDGMIDYFHVDFYYFGCCRNNGSSVKIVPKKPRIKNKGAKVATKAGKRETAKKESTPLINAGNLTYTIKQGEDTRDLSTLWVVRIEETLTKEEYIKVNKRMKTLGGYYSKFKHGFIFREDPTNLLKSA